MKLYFDGGARPNPGKMCICIVLNNEPQIEWLGEGTNNKAEWIALCRGLTIAHEKGITELEVIGDSALVVNQANGDYKVKNQELKTFKDQFDLLAKKFTKLNIRWEPRANNLAGIHLEQQQKKPPTVEPTVNPSKQLSDEQNACLSAIRAFANSEYDYFVVHGLAGTGKTTVLTQFANEQDMHLVTYTGKASSVLRDKSGLEATTIHKLIYIPIIDPLTGKILGFQRLPQSLRGKIVGVDECSMVNEGIAKDLLRTGAKILAFGDPGQLPPVEGKPYFNKPDFRLNEIHRQAQESPIIRQAHSVRSGGTYAADTDKFRIVWGLSDDELMANDIVLCWMNKTRKSINNRFRALLGYSGPPRAGEAIVCLKNAHKFGLYNGAIYTLEKDFDPSSKSGTMTLTIDGMSVEVPKVVFAKPQEERFEQIQMRLGSEKFETAFDFGYCLTVHKSQGSEWRNVAVVDEYPNNSDPRFADRTKWLYTAITRAAEGIIISR